MMDKSIDACKDCKAHNVTMLEMGYMDRKISELEKSVSDMYSEIECNKKEISSDFSSRFKEFKESFSTSVDKLKIDIQNLFVDQRNLRESVMEIKNTVERSTDKVAMKMESMEKLLVDLMADKKDTKNTFINPLMIGIITVTLTALLTGLGYLVIMQLGGK
jgi:predicted  nucleic acid-binding Zn-ribbon protein